MKATDQLRDEHQGILLMLAILDKVVVKLSAEGSLNREHFKGMLDFFTIFVDKCHHGKEEDLLFPAYESAGIPNINGPIGVMLAEHAQGRVHVRGMAEAFQSFKSGESDSVSRMAECAEKYITLLRQHIGKENDILYPMGDALLSEEQNKKLLAGFDAIESERVGTGRHEKFHAMLNNLRNIYIG